MVKIGITVKLENLGEFLVDVCAVCVTEFGLQIFYIIFIFYMFHNFGILISK